MAQCMRDRVHGLHLSLPVCWTEGMNGPLFLVSVGLALSDDGHQNFQVLELGSAAWHAVDSTVVMWSLCVHFSWWLG